MVDAFYSKNKANLTLGLVIAVVVAVVAFAVIAIFADKTDAPAPPKPVAVANPDTLPLQVHHFGNWTLACGSQKGEDCALVFNAVDKSRKHLLLRLSVVETAKGPAMLVMAPPTDKTPANFTIAPDKGASVTVPYTRCAPGLCETGFTINDAMRTALTSSQSAEVKFIAGAQPLSFRIPLSGFPQGYAAWSARQPKGSPAAPNGKATPPPRGTANSH